MTLELARLCGLAAMLLSFAILAGRRVQGLAYAAQCGAVVLLALSQAVLQGDLSLLAVAVLVAAQAALVWRNRPVLAPGTAFPVVTLCAALLLVVLATASVPSDGMGVPLVMVLLGLLGAAALTGPYGVLTLLNGVITGMAVVPGLPLRPLLTLAMVALALLVVQDGRRLILVRR